MKKNYPTRRETPMAVCRACQLPLKQNKEMVVYCDEHGPMEFPQDATCGVERIIEAAHEHARRHHSHEVGPEMAIGDLEQALRAAWDLMTDEQRDALMENDTVKENLAWGAERERDRDEREQQGTGACPECGSLSPWRCGHGE